MRKVRNSIFTKLIIVATLVLFMVAQHPGVLSSAETAKATVAVKHKPLKYFVAGHRLQVEAKVTDPQGVSLVRCYFRAAGQADYVFVGMKAGEKDVFTGILPAPSAETKVIEYLLLTVNSKNQVVKTQVFKTEWKDPKVVSPWDKVTGAASSLVSKKPASDVPVWQQVSGEGHVTVSTELSQATAPSGFSDSVVTDVVESSVRFGYVAGLYVTTQAAASGAAGVVAGGATGASAEGATGAAATATSAGTVSASAGLSTAVIVGASAAAIVVGAMAVSGGGGDDNSLGPDAAKVVGVWVGSGLWFEFTSGGDVSATNNGTNLRQGTYSVSGSSISGTMSGEGETITFSATISGNTMTGSWRSSGGGGSVSFTLTKQ